MFYFNGTRKKLHMLRSQEVQYSTCIILISIYSHVGSADKTEHWYEATAFYSIAVSHALLSIPINKTPCCGAKATHVLYRLHVSALTKAKFMIKVHSPKIVEWP